MLSMLIPHKQRLLELPIVLSEPAWLRCVHIRDFLFEELRSSQCRNRCLVPCDPARAEAGRRYALQSVFISGIR